MFGRMKIIYSFKHDISLIKYISLKFRTSAKNSSNIERQIEGVIMEIRKLDYNFSVCKVEDFSMVDLESEYCFIGKTDEEKSVVCITEIAPQNTVERDDGWKAFRIQGILDFSLIGILAKISSLLAQNEIGIFVVSTYNTDYILTKAENYLRALEVLDNAGYKII